MSGILSLRDYQTLINLHPKPLNIGNGNIDYPSILREIIQYLTGRSDSAAQYSVHEQRAFIRHTLTVRDPSSGPLRPPRLYDLIDAMLIYERDKTKILTQAMHLPVQFASMPYIRVWRGDITTLIVDSIVNAGNSGLLGCFQPTHLCIDNIIHAAAGPRLRDDCYTIMQQQQRFEPEGHAKITAAYNLPSKYVLHTVGPQLYEGARVTHSDDQTLASCYTACLNLAAEMDTITSVAFCCISTGLFAFPADRACHIAIKTVTEWFQQRIRTNRLSLIVFNVFTEDDERRYFDALTNFQPSNP